GNVNYLMTDVKQEGMDNRNIDLTYHYNLVFNNAATAFDKDLYLDLDFRKEFSEASIDTTSRHHDYLFECKEDRITEANLAIPAGYTVSGLPPALDIQRNGYGFSLSYKQEGNVLKYRKTIVLKDVHLPRSAFRQWNADIALLKKAYLQQVTLTKK
ncbi:hypothetical protein, partial [Puia sp.]|uniref:hypothetical protein n=1 Tax=Puia sp. TaxID=2045100 RepID=UPI002F3FB695